MSCIINVIGIEIFIALDIAEEYEVDFIKHLKTVKHLFA